MGFEFIKKLPTPDEIRNQYPIDAKIKALKEKRDQEIRDVFTGKSDKFLAIIGPCSADNEDASEDPVPALLLRQSFFLLYLYSRKKELHTEAKEEAEI